MLSKKKLRNFSLGFLFIEEFLEKHRVYLFKYFFSLIKKSNDQFNLIYSVTNFLKFKHELINYLKCLFKKQILIFTLEAYK